KMSCLLGRLPDLDGHGTALPYLNAVLEQLLRADRGAPRRSNYAWAMVHTAFLASSLRLDRISALEFGVAGGNGLIAMERMAAWLENHFGLRIDVYGFDGGRGLPKPRDWRDLPNLWPEGAYPMDEQKLRARLRRAELILGMVEDTVGEFLASEPAPIGFVAFDLDQYTSTTHAFKVLQAEPRLLMPRIHCYFDDILGYTCGHHNGERLAISEFNAAQPNRPISQIYGLRFCLPRKLREANWTEKMFMTHIVEHPLYNEWDGMLRNARRDLAA
ncbi:MAG: hypothetical protein ACYSTY_11530, partial [Planctomycetota bacterium]